MLYVFTYYPLFDYSCMDLLAQFTEEGTSFSPPCAAIQDMLASACEAVVHTANGISRLLYIRPFNDLLATSAAAATTGGNMQDGQNVNGMNSTTLGATANGGRGVNTQVHSHSYLGMCGAACDVNVCMLD